MKVIGIILIIAGIGMLIVRGFSWTESKEVVDLGPVEVNQKQTKTVYWPYYAGGVAVVAGIALVFAGAKNKE